LIYWTFDRERQVRTPGASKFKEAPMLTKFALVLAVTAAVTSAALAGLLIRAKANVKYTPTITNLDTGHKYPFARNYDGAVKCDAALGNLPQFFAALRDPSTTVPVPDYVGDDKELGEATMGVALQILMNTGKLPNFSIACEPTGDPE
jgi:hypothetical protein